MQPCIHEQFDHAEEFDLKHAPTVLHHPLALEK